MAIMPYGAPLTLNSGKRRLGLPNSGLTLRPQLRSTRPRSSAEPSAEYRSLRLGHIRSMLTGCRSLTSLNEDRRKRLSSFCFPLQRSIHHDVRDPRFEDLYFFHASVKNFTILYNLHNNYVQLAQCTECTITEYNIIPTTYSGIPTTYSGVDYEKLSFFGHYNSL